MSRVQRSHREHDLCTPEVEVEIARPERVSRNEGNHSHESLGW